MAIIQWLFVAKADEQDKYFDETKEKSGNFVSSLCTRVA